MLLIRGIRGFHFAEPINRGLIGFRDVQSTIASTNSTGYAKSGYEEFLFEKTRFANIKNDKSIESLPLLWRRAIMVLADSMMTESYLTYFHILESEESLMWLEENWDNDEDVHFIYYEPRFECGQSVVGSGYCGQRIQYVDAPESIDIRRTVTENPGLLVSLGDREISTLPSLEEKIAYTGDYVESMVPLFNRVVDEKFNASENEFRLLARSNRFFTNGTLRIERYNPKRIRCGSTIYDVKFEMGDSFDGKLQSLEFSFSDIKTGKEVPFGQLLQGEEKPEVLSSFLNVDVRDTAIRYGYIGGKDSCRVFIERWLEGNLDLDYEDENHHVHKGKWQDYLTCKKRKALDEEITVLRIPEDKHYSWYGNGFRQAALHSPLEFGFENPYEAFINVLSELTVRNIESGDFTYPMTPAREILCNSIGPWLPLRLYCQIDVCKSIDWFKPGDVVEPFLLTPKDDRCRASGNVLIDLNDVRDRMRGSIAQKRMQDTIEMQKGFIGDDEIVDFPSIFDMSLLEFEAWKSNTIESIIDSLPVFADKFRDEIHVCSLWDSLDGCIRNQNISSVVAQYEIDPYWLRCSCDEAESCEYYIAMTLAPTLCSGVFNATELSHVLSNSSWFLPYPSESLYLTLINVASHESASYTCNGEWRLICGNCPRRKGEMRARIMPVHLYVMSMAKKDERVVAKNLGTALGIPVDLDV